MYMGLNDSYIKVENIKNNRKQIKKINAMIDANDIDTGNWCHIRILLEV